jgi:hypothetical protein
MIMIRPTFHFYFILECAHITLLSGLVLRASLNTFTKIRFERNDLCDHAQREKFIFLYES